jgi:hypothetical protein
MSGKIISGPLNIIKLTGNINGIDKELYVFLDWHAPLQIETSCKTDKTLPQENIIDIKDFIADKITTSVDEIDFFLEIKYSDIRDGLDERAEDIYIIRLRKFFNDFKSKNKDPKKRLHYVDIRDIPLHHLLTNLHYDEDFVNDIINNPTMLSTLQADDENLINLKDDLEDSIRYIENITDTFNELIRGTFDKEKYDKLSVENKISTKLFMKLIHSYITEKNKKNIQMFVKQYIDRLNMLKRIGDFIVQQNLNVYNQTLYYYIRNYFDQFRMANSSLLDYYFIRRFLDKNYIKKGLLYCGFEHSIDIIILLVMYFDMKIVNSSYKKRNTNDEELTYDYINSSITDLSMNYMHKREFIRNTFIKNFDAGPDRWIQCSTDILE